MDVDLLKMRLYADIVLRLPALVAVALSLLSCGIVELDSGQMGGTGIWVDNNSQIGKPGGGGNPAGGSQIPIISESCYMTAVEYPSGYDWKADLQKGSVRCSLVVYIDGIPRMKVAVGDAYQISSDADMHRIEQGNLYTDYSTDTQTVIKKNGTEILRWSGRESLKGLKVVGEDIYTLGQARSGDGFSFRKNGEVIVSKDKGYVYEHLDYDSESGITFTFCEMIPSQSAAVERHYVVKDGVASLVGLRDDILCVWDVVMHKGKPCYVSSVKGSEDLMLADGEQLTVLKVPEGASVFAAKIFLSGDSVFVEAVCGMDYDFTSVVWKDGMELSVFERGLTVVSFDESQGSYCCVLNSSSREGGGLIYRNGQKYNVPEGYLSAGNYTSAFVNGILYVGLSPVNGNRPIIWKDGELQEMKFNGFITSVQSVSAIP